MLAQVPRAAGVRRVAWAPLALVCVTAAVGCGPRRAEPPVAAVPRPAVVPPTAPAVPPGAQVYAVDAEHSVVTLRVYRAGRLAMLGHNHVITSGSETGQVWTDGDPAGSGFDVRLAVADLVVDDPGARAAAGAEFPGELPDAAREGTRRNMLRPEVLDGDHYPELGVHAEALGGTWEHPVVTAAVTLKGRTRMVSLPLEIDREAGALTARGAFRILQSDFGITPFSVGGGALAVADEVDVAFEIRCQVCKMCKIGNAQSCTSCKPDTF